MTHHKSDAGRRKIVTLPDYGMIEPSKSPWASRVVVDETKRNQLRFCCEFQSLHSATVKDAYPIPRIDESLSKFGCAKFLLLLI